MNGTQYVYLQRQNQCEDQTVKKAVSMWRSHRHGQYQCLGHKGGIEVQVTLTEAGSRSLAKAVSVSRSH